MQTSEWGFFSSAPVPASLLHPIIVGAFAINNANFDIMAMLGFGIQAFFMIRNKLKVALCILGLVLGHMLDSSLMQCMLKSDWDLTASFPARFQPPWACSAS